MIQNEAVALIDKENLSNSGPKEWDINSLALLTNSLYQCQSDYIEEDFYNKVCLLLMKSDLQKENITDVLHLFRAILHYGTDDQKK